MCVNGKTITDSSVFTEKRKIDFKILNFVENNGLRFKV